MTKQVAMGPLRFTIIEREARRICQMCGAAKETRPYGPGGMRVCFACGMKDEEEARRRFLGDIDAAKGE